MIEDQMRQPEARLARAKEILALQGYVARDGAYKGRHYRALIDTDRPTNEPPGIGARPSYVIQYFN